MSYTISQAALFSGKEYLMVLDDISGYVIVDNVLDAHGNTIEEHKLIFTGPRLCPFNVDTVYTLRVPGILGLLMTVDKFILSKAYHTEDECGFIYEMVGHKNRSVANNESLGGVD